MEKNTVTRKWFRNWANEYDSTLGKIKRHHRLLDLVVKSSSVRGKDGVLDIGCGTGLLSLKFLQKTDCAIHGIDSSPAMLQIFRDKIDKLHLSGKISCGLMDARKLNFPENSFDIVASTVTLHHVDNKYPVIRKIHSLLKPGGKFVLGDIDVDTTGSLRDPKRLLRIVDYLKTEYVLAMREGGVKAFRRIYDNGKKHILNDGEFCVSFKQWQAICWKAGFRKITISPLPGFRWFKVLVAVK